MVAKHDLDPSVQNNSPLLSRLVQVSPPPGILVLIAGMFGLFAVGLLGFTSVGLEKKVAEKEVAVVNLNQQVDSLTRRANTAIEKENEARAENKRIQEVWEQKYQGQETKHRSELGAVKKKLAQTQQELAETKVENENLARALSGTEEKLTVAQTRITELTEEVGKISRELKIHGVPHPDLVKLQYQRAVELFAEAEDMEPEERVARIAAVCDAVRAITNDNPPHTFWGGRVRRLYSERCRERSPQR